MKRAGDLLKDFFDNLGIKKGEGETVFSAWPDIAGKEISSHSRISDIKKELVTIEADHPGWVQIIDFKKAQILKKINEKFPEKNIQEIRVILKKPSKR